MNMFFKNWLLNEMPIRNIELKGKWGQKDPKYGYTSTDQNILTNEKGIEKILKKWKRIEYDFDIYFVKTKDHSKYLQHGEITPEQAKNLFDINHTQEDQITIIFTNNVGTDRMPMNYWTIAHRFAHSLRRNDIFLKEFVKETKRLFNSLKEEYLQININDIDMAYLFGTMKSCRERNLLNFEEFLHELFAQYIITNNIKLNRINKNIIYKKYERFAKPQAIFSRMNEADIKETNLFIEVMEKDIIYHIEAVLSHCHNKIFVM